MLYLWKARGSRISNITFWPVNTPTTPTTWTLTCTRVQILFNTKKRRLQSRGPNSRTWIIVYNDQLFCWYMLLREQWFLRWRTFLVIFCSNETFITISKHKLEYWGMKCYSRLVFAHPLYGFTDDIILHILCRDSLHWWYFFAHPL